jgi:hypothetical protein
MVSSGGRGRLGVVVGIVCVLLLTGCQWSMGRFGPNGSGANPYERAIGVSNVDDLVLDRSASVTGIPAGAPVAFDNYVFVSSTGAGGGLRAFSVTGAGCSGVPADCQPLWSSETSAIVGQAVVANDLVIVSVGSDLHAYDALGVRGCRGEPKICEPLWLALGWAGHPVVANGRVIVTSDLRVGSFDLFGQQGCSGKPAFCTPQWTYGPLSESGLVGFGPPAVADGVVYFGVMLNDSFINGGDFGWVMALDADGVDGCSGVPVTCTYLWSADTGSVSTSPAVVDGVVYVVGRRTFEDDEGLQGGYTELAAFDAAECLATAPQGSCAPDWTGRSNEQYRFANPSVAVADGLVHVTGGAAGTATFAVGGGPSCVANRCAPLRRSATTGDRPLAVANGVLFAGRQAFDASGTSGCSGSPVLCQPLWTTPLAGTTTSVVTNGRVLTLTTSGTSTVLSNYRLP